MSDLRQNFSTAVHDEPPLRTSTEAIVRAGARRTHRRRATTAVAGGAVAALAATGIVALPRVLGPAPATTAASAPSAPSAPKSGDGDAPADLAAVKESQAAKAAEIAAAFRAELAAAGYTITEFGTDGREHLDPAYPRGRYAIKAAVTKGAATGAFSLSVTSSASDASGWPDEFLFTDDGDSRRLQTYGADGSERVVQYYPSEGPIATDAVLRAFATDAALDLSTVIALSGEQIAQLNAEPAHSPKAQTGRKADSKADNTYETDITGKKSLVMDGAKRDGSKGGAKTATP